MGIISKPDPFYAAVRSEAVTAKPVQARLSLECALACALEESSYIGHVGRPPDSHHFFQSGCRNQTRITTRVASSW